MNRGGLALCGIALLALLFVSGDLLAKKPVKPPPQPEPSHHRGLPAANASASVRVASDPQMSW